MALPRPAPTLSLRSTRGFTLVELLVVLGIILLVMGILAPNVGGILKGKKIEQAISAISLSMEEARNTARSQNTYVWTGFALMPSGKSQSGQDEIWVMNFRVKPDKKRLPSGDSSGISAGGIIVPVSPLTRIEGVSVIPRDSLPPAFPDFTEISSRAEDFALSPESATPANWIRGGSSSAQAFSRLILFTPRGEGLLENGGPDLPSPKMPYTIFCLAQTLGGKPLPNSKDAAVLIVSALNGRITTLRPGSKPIPAAAQNGAQ
jgi:prepilin-type N-terminal cleavage/methylation domain-containing protein